jgi:Flp pilus assembly protein TadG
MSDENELRPAMLNNLRKKITQTYNKEQGAVAVMIALSMTVLFSFAAMAVDMGMAYITASQAQKAADMSALAAAELLPVHEDNGNKQAELIATAEEYLAKNGFTDPAEYVISLGTPKDGQYTSIDVDIYTKSETTFAKVIGVNNIDLHRGATAALLVVNSAIGVVPVSVETTALEQFLADDPTQSVILKYGTKTDAVVNGAFGALDVDGSVGGGASDYEDYLAFGYSGSLEVGDAIPVETGNMTGPTYDGLSSRYYSCTHFVSEGGCTAEHYVDDCPRIMTVPVVTYTDKHEVVIDSFALFIIEDIETYADKGFVVGRYISGVINNAYGDTSGTVEDFGAYTIALIR